MSADLVHQVEAATDAWAAKGNKAGRARQRNMMRAFAAHAAARGARDVGQFGRRTVIDYWIGMEARGRSHATQMDHWRALRELWRLLGKPGDPPPPRPPTAEPPTDR